MADAPIRPSVDTLEQRLDSMDKAISLLQETTNRMPTPAIVASKLDALKELTQVQLNDAAALNTALNNQRDKYELRIADILADQRARDALLLSTQVDKLGVTTGERLGVIEKNQYVAGGQTSVRDPATAEALALMTRAIATLSTAGSKTEGKSEGINAAWGIVLGVAALIGTTIVVASFIIARAP